MSNTETDLVVCIVLSTLYYFFGLSSICLFTISFYIAYRLFAEDTTGNHSLKKDSIKDETISKRNIEALRNNRTKLAYRKVGNKLEFDRQNEESSLSKNGTVSVDFTHSFKKSSGELEPQKSNRIKRKGAKIIRKKNIVSTGDPKLVVNNSSLLTANFLVFYSSLTGSSERTAKYMFNKLLESKEIQNTPKLINIDDDIDDLDDYFLKVPEDLENIVYILVLPSYETDSPIDFFLQTLEENSTDFRIDSYPLKTKIAGYSVIGVGDREHYPNKFCYQAVLADKYLNKLGGRRIFPLSKFCIKNDQDSKIQEWCDFYVDSLKDNEAMILDAYNEHDEDSDDEQDQDSGTDDTMMDIEDIGDSLQKQDSSTSTDDQVDAEIKEVKEMVAKDSPTYKSLTKQGYTVVGSHSGVKICRWTKSALRNRGSCYKFAFYGIRSHLCMETTPSLSCSNKCVFCWRHGTNPVGTNWRWQVDGPEEILKGALEGHYKKIKQMRGVPGINSERFQEAFTVRHCALSLVGEPIFYPYINEFISMLHAKRISSFLVCNAQHPEQLKNLKRVTQLYVSIDAPTKSDLKKVDRPLYRDFWERLNNCLEILNTIQSHQRTVFRLTLVKGFNMNEIMGYADMVEKANPSLIEIKGATFCGSSTGNGNPLTMQNIPFYEECKNFVLALTAELQKRNLGYDIAAEHAHSCCILVANTKYKINNKWCTHIDYEKFFNLLELEEDFDELDYCTDTPSWAYWESKEAGFNPDDVRYNRKEEKLKKKIARDAELATTSV